MSNNSLRTIAGSCLILSIPSVALANGVKDGVILGLVSVALLILLSPLKMDTEKGLATACLIAVTVATLLNVFPAIGLAETPAPTLLIVFNVVLLGYVSRGGVSVSVLSRVKQSLLTGIFFLAAIALLLGLKTAFGYGLGAGSGLPRVPTSRDRDAPVTWQLALLLYPGGVMLVAGVLYLLLREREMEANSSTPG